MKQQRIIIIGGGLGALATGIRLVADGHHVKIIEKKEHIGGWIGEQIVNGFRFDTGASLISAPFLLDQLFEYAGKKMDDYLQLQEIDPIFTAIFPVLQTFNFYREPAASLIRNSNYSVADQKDFHDYGVESDRYLNEVFFDYASKAPQKGLIADVKRQRFKRQASAEKLTDSVNAAFNYPYLQQLHSFWPMIAGGNPARCSHFFRVISSILQRWPSYSPIGGMGKLCQTLERVFLECGGEIFCNSEVQAIQIFNRKATGIRLNDGSIQQADVVISDVDIFTTMLQLIDSDRTTYPDVEKIKTKKSSCSVYVYHFGLKTRLKEKTALSAHNFIFPANYEKNIYEVFEDGSIPSDPFIYLKIPTKQDESAAPSGCEALSVIIPVPNLAAGIDWGQSSYQFRSLVLDRVQTLFETDLRQNLIAESYCDPSLIEKNNNSWLGNAFSISPEFFNGSAARYPNSSIGIQNLYYCGAGAHPGPFIPGILMGAAITAQKVNQNS